MKTQQWPHGLRHCYLRYSDFEILNQISNRTCVFMCYFLVLKISYGPIAVQGLSLKSKR
jgi:hypothetical protein